MDDKSGESALYDRIALRFKGGISEFIVLIVDLPEELATRIVNNKVLANRLIVSPIPSSHV